MELFLFLAVHRLGSLVRLVFVNSLGDSFGFGFFLNFHNFFDAGVLFNLENISANAQVKSFQSCLNRNEQIRSVFGLLAGMGNADNIAFLVNQGAAERNVLNRGADQNFRTAFRRITITGDFPLLSR